MCEAGARQKELEVICLRIQYEQRKYMSPFRESSKGCRESVIIPQRKFTVEVKKNWSY